MTAYAGSRKVSSSVPDAVWEAVEFAILHNWTVERFLREVREAWAEAREQQADADAEAFKTGGVR